MNRFIENPIIRWSIILVSFFISIELISSIIGNLHRNDTLSQRQMVLHEEQSQNQTLKKELKEATSASFIERIARDKLGLAREGETIIFMAKPQVSDNQTESLGPPQSLWERWWKLFF